MTLTLRVAAIAVLLLSTSAVLSVRALPACAEDVFKQGEWDEMADAPCVPIGGPGQMIHGTLANHDDFDWIRLRSGAAPVVVSLAVRGDTTPTIYVVAPGLPPPPSFVDLPRGLGAQALGRADGAFFYRTFLRTYRRVAMGETPPQPDVLLLVTGGPADYLLGVGSRPGFSLRSLAAYPAALLREWIGAHD